MDSPTTPVASNGTPSKVSPLGLLPPFHAKLKQTLNSGGSDTLILSPKLSWPALPVAQGARSRSNSQVTNDNARTRFLEEDDFQRTRDYRKSTSFKNISNSIDFKKLQEKFQQDEPVLRKKPLWVPANSLQTKPKPRIHNGRWEATPTEQPPKFKRRELEACLDIPEPEAVKPVEPEVKSEVISTEVRHLEETRDTSINDKPEGSLGAHTVLPVPSLDKVYPTSAVPLPVDLSILSLQMSATTSSLSLPFPPPAPTTGTPSSIALSLPGVTCTAPPMMIPERSAPTSVSATLLAAKETPSSPVSTSSPRAVSPQSPSTTTEKLKSSKYPSGTHSSMTSTDSQHSSLLVSITTSHSSYDHEFSAEEVPKHRVTVRNPDSYNARRNSLLLDLEEGKNQLASVMDSICHAIQLSPGTSVKRESTDTQGYSFDGDNEGDTDDTSNLSLEKPARLAGPFTPHRFSLKADTESDHKDTSYSTLFNDSALPQGKSLSEKLAEDPFLEGLATPTYTGNRSSRSWTSQISHSSPSPSHAVSSPIMPSQRCHNDPLPAAPPSGKREARKPVVLSYVETKRLRKLRTTRSFPNIDPEKQLEDKAQTLVENDVITDYVEPRNVPRTASMDMADLHPHGAIYQCDVTPSRLSPGSSTLKKRSSMPVLMPSSYVDEEILEISFVNDPVRKVFRTERDLPPLPFHREVFQDPLFTSANFRSPPPVPIGITPFGSMPLEAKSKHAKPNVKEFLKKLFGVKQRNHRKGEFVFVCASPNSKAKPEQTFNVLSFANAFEEKRPSVQLERPVYEPVPLPEVLDTSPVTESNIVRELSVPRILDAVDIDESDVTSLFSDIMEEDEEIVEEVMDFAPLSEMTLGFGEGFGDLLAAIENIDQNFLLPKKSFLPETSQSPYREDQRLVFADEVEMKALSPRKSMPLSLKRATPRDEEYTDDNLVHISEEIQFDASDVGVVTSPDHSYVEGTHFNVDYDHNQKVPVKGLQPSHSTLKKARLIPDVVLSRVVSWDSYPEAIVSKGVTFSTRLVVSETYGAHFYDRINREMTVTQLQDNPAAIREIKRELNEFKAKDMPVHDLSKNNTHFFYDVYKD
ncbi:hypothetical protein BABINDRAFT_168754 [Babjeviella inositovora NRRL Y-12698]|uniref:Uncharacterized protein n=1 Tax=Babjeviella inositovora NRRL Y-12698 TaxID=984486 RepID=A0A1E3QL29_9ASCO|nr:uncharacterized protein BABINDRAFT_168754 [Babjeviella inositovora NRRL Y-12698]ODQ77792.1 hypothetical protein BABINDRAFT_168754 [Babjeviella inositovora NRRL Y-12698]